MTYNGGSRFGKAVNPVWKGWQKCVRTSGCTLILCVPGAGCSTPIACTPGALLVTLRVHPIPYQHIRVHMVKDSSTYRCNKRKIKNSATPRLQSMSFFDEISEVENQIYRSRSGISNPRIGNKWLEPQECCRSGPSALLLRRSEEWDAQATRWLVCD